MSEHNIHKYKRITLKPSKKVIYKCQLTHCNHYLFEPLVWNKITICWSCDSNFILAKRKNNQVKPKCPNCMTVKSEKIDTLFEGMF